MSVGVLGSVVSPLVTQGEPSSTNSPGWGSRTDPEVRVVGTDTIRLGGPVLTHGLPEVHVRRVAHPATGELEEHFVRASVMLLCGVPLYVRTMNGQPWAYFERSVPTWLGRCNRTAASLGEVLRLVDHVYAEAAQHLAWGCAVEDLRVSRWDVTRDFLGVEDIPLVLEALHCQPTGRRIVSAAWRDPLADLNSIVRTVRGRWAVTAYDKAEQLRGMARRQREPAQAAFLREQAQQAQGQLRVEVRIRRAVAREQGLDLLGDISESRLQTEARRIFEMAGMTATVHGGDGLRRAAASPISNAALGALVRRSMGIDPVVAKNTAKRYRREYDASGLAPSHLVAAPCALSLDFDRGVRVLECER